VNNLYEQFTRDITSKPAAADNPWDHAQSLLENDVEGAKIIFRDILNKDLKLSQIKDSHLLRLYQNDIETLVLMLDASTREPALLGVFISMFWIIRGELTATRALNGNERRMQGGPGVGIRILGSTPAGMEQPLQGASPEEENELKGIIESLTKRKKREG
jgi:hypothetical protein